MKALTLSLLSATLFLSAFQAEAYTRGQVKQAVHRAETAYNNATPAQQAKVRAKVRAFVKNHR